MSTTCAFAGFWDSLPTPLTPWILDVIQSMGHSQMTPVQASTIPLFMKHKDVVVEAVTGSGKTLAFVIPVLERLIRRERRLKRDEIGALVISPTRELASQIHTIFSLFLTSQPEGEDSSNEPYPAPLLLVSSEQSSPLQDIQRFIATGADIVIGTPGRIEEFLLGKGRSSVNVKELEVLVLDEADRLLDLGFQVVLTRIITHLPKQRRTGLFSATMTDADAISELVRVGLRNPARIVVKVQTKKIGAKADLKNPRKGEVIEERRTPANLQNYYIDCRASEKLLQLIRILSHETNEKQSSHFIVYFATCACVDYFYKVLPTVASSKIKFYSLHGNLSPNTRTRTLDAFSSSSSLSVLLATDVAARGLDIPHVDAVIQFDPPTDTKSFSHRCGRTARAGRNGTAWVLLSGREIEFRDFLNVRKIPLKEWPYLKARGTPLSNDETRPEDPEVEDSFSQIRAKLKSDRALHDLSMKAFVSFVKAYSKHEASYIFRVKDLDLIGLAKSYGLLRLPKMPELKQLNRDGWQDADISWDTYQYADDAQETKRVAAMTQGNLEKDQERERQRAQRLEQRHQNAAWSVQSGKKGEREKRKEKKKLKQKWVKSQKAELMSAAGVTTSGKRPREEDAKGDAEDDWDELAREEKMAKRVRKGEISQKEFDAEFGDLEGQ